MNADNRIFKRKLYERMLNWKHTKDFAKDQETIMLPAYMVPFL